MSDDNKTIFKKRDTMMYSIYELEKRSFIQYVCDFWSDDLDTKGFYCELTSHPLYSYLLLKFRKGKAILDKNSEKALREYVKVLWEEVKERVRQEEVIFICQTCNKDIDYCKCPACCVDCGKIHPFSECEQEDNNCDECEFRKQAGLVWNNMNLCEPCYAQYDCERLNLADQEY